MAAIGHRWALPVLAFCAARSLCAYSVLSHEAMIDALWDTGLRAALLARFPNATPAQLKEAHSYAYGGAVLQDMGYYPHGNGYFSDLTHYARTADFIEALIHDSQTLDEYAFALGALSHYAGDNDGHRLGTNRAEPLVYRNLQKKFGDVVTYEDNPTDHLRTEYAFDVEQVAKGNYAPEAYHDFIGFNVSAALLQRAFRETYGFELNRMLNDFDQAIGSYRHALSTLIPLFTRVAWADHQDQIRTSRPGITRARFLYVMRRSSYEREWGKKYDRPTLADRILAFLVKILPPIGRVSVLKFKPLGPGVEQIFMKSFDTASAEYRSDVRGARQNGLQLANNNFDVGLVTKPGEYGLQDQTYAYWLDELAATGFAGVTPEISKNILAFYSDLNAPLSTKKHPKQWQQVLTELNGLKARQGD
ncbi:MAG: zinc dependent phospholipase C family protein [Acidobacteriaceae bacterium]|nr:zinc dependent phospholipase C family protein [Acidobacteriaceae bacterium]